jgi:hypothetical protein
MFDDGELMAGNNMAELGQNRRIAVLAIRLLSPQLQLSRDGQQIDEKSDEHTHAAQPKDAIR